MIQTYLSQWRKLAIENPTCRFTILTSRTGNWAACIEYGACRGKEVWNTSPQLDAAIKHSISQFQQLAPFDREGAKR